MKNCNSIEKKLMAYLHGELAPREAEKLQVHLDGCESCRAALEAQRATLELLGDALGTAFAPERLTARRYVPNRVPAHRPSFADIWFSPRFKAVCVASVFAVAFVFFSGTLVVVSVKPMEAPCFEVAPVARPKMPLKEITVPLEVKKKKPKPRLRKRIVSSKAVPESSEIRMPEITGVKGGLGNMGGDGLGSLGFDLADGELLEGITTENVVSYSAAASDSSAPIVTVGQMAGNRRELQRVDELASTDPLAPPAKSDEAKSALYAKGEQLSAEGNYDQAEKVFETILVNDPYDASAMVALNRTAQRKNERNAETVSPTRTAAMAEVDATWNANGAVALPNMPLKKLKVRTKKPDKPKSTAKLTAVVDTIDLNSISFPDLPSSGIGTGISADDYVVGYSGYSVGTATEEKKSEVVVVSGKAPLVAVNGNLGLQSGDYFFADADQSGTADERVPLQVEYPRPLFAGTPKSVFLRTAEGENVDAREGNEQTKRISGGDRVVGLGYSSGLAGESASRFAYGRDDDMEDVLLGEPVVVTKSGSVAGVEIPIQDGQTILITPDVDMDGLDKDSGGDDLFGVTIEAEEVPDRLKERKPAEFNPYVLAVENAFSTFSIDVDTAAYGLARQQLLAGGLPEPESVRTEEFVNSFDYDYRPPAGKQTFAVHSEMAPSPFRTSMDVLKVGIKGRRIGRDDHRGAMLTLVIDTSGSMSTPERMGLIKTSLMLLLDELDPNDEVAIVQFGGEARLVLDHTPVAQKEALLNAVTKLQPAGPTQFDLGLELGYAMATSSFKAGASNRIIIMSDGVANVGELDPEAMLEKVGEHRRKGIYLSVLGFGAGTYDDDLLERLANRGDGMYAYIDSLDEAKRLLVDQLAATLHVIASDVKIQVEFNPDRVLRYRQLGYENRQLTKEQFRDDTVDAGEVGSGQSVTALYDVELDPAGDPRDPIATVYVRYRRADNGAVEEISNRITDTGRRERFEESDVRFQLAACTAEFAERLRCSPYAEGTEISEILSRLEPVAMELDLDAQVQELLRLILIANRLGN